MPASTSSSLSELSLFLIGLLSADLHQSSSSFLCTYSVGPTRSKAPGLRQMRADVKLEHETNVVRIRPVELNTETIDARYGGLFAVELLKRPFARLGIRR